MTISSLHILQRMKNRYIAECGIDTAVGLFVNYLDNRDLEVSYTKNEDGSFSGEFIDDDMGINTRYYSSFTGEFTDIQKETEAVLLVQEKLSGAMKGGFDMKHKLTALEREMKKLKLSFEHSSKQLIEITQMYTGCDETVFNS